MRDEKMSNNKVDKNQKLDLQRAPLSDLVLPKTEQEPEVFSSVDPKDLSESLTKAQNQLGLCLQRQRQVGFILREVKDILKR